MATAINMRLHATKNDLPENVRIDVIESLNQSLACAHDLKSHVKQAHWNVRGKDFFQLHELFDILAGEVEAHVDLIAERATTLGGIALGTARLAASKSLLPEYPHDISLGEDHLKALIDRYAVFAKHLRECIDRCEELGDADTADLYTEVSRNIDMRLWFLEAHINP